MNVAVLLGLNARVSITKASTRSLGASGRSSLLFVTVFVWEHWFLVVRGRGSGTGNYKLADTYVVVHILSILF
jgi:hypothetical protein